MPNGPYSYAIAASALPKGPVCLESGNQPAMAGLREALGEDRAFLVFSRPLLTATLLMGPKD
jgi:hypothetical protein